MRLIDKYKKIQRLGYEEKIPWHVAHVLSNEHGSYISVSGSDVSLGEDYVSLEQARKAVEWYANQLGGRIKWED